MTSLPSQLNTKKTEKKKLCRYTRYKKMEKNNKDVKLQQKYKKKTSVENLKTAPRYYFEVGKNKLNKV